MKRAIRRVVRDLGFEATVAAFRADLARRQTRSRTAGMLKAYQRQAALPRKFHFGCGDRRVAGWLNCDQVGSEVDIDLSVGALPFADGAFDAVCSQHVIEHLELFTELEPLLKEVFRCTAPGGEIWLSCPDIEKLCRGYIADKCEALVADRLARWPNYQMHGYPSSIFANDLFHQSGQHKNLFDFDMLVHLLEKTGYVDVTLRDEAALLARFPEFPPRNDDDQTIYVSARKAS